MSFNLAELQNCSGSQWVSGILEGIELDPDSQDRFDDQLFGEFHGEVGGCFFPCIGSNNKAHPPGKVNIEY